MVKINRLIENLTGTQSQHAKEDSLIDLNEESSYMKQSQPEPDIHGQSRSVYSNQRLPLQVSDQPTQNNHQRMPSDSSILDEPIDVPEQEPITEHDFAVNFDDRTYANFPSNLDQYGDQSFSSENPLASSSRIQFDNNPQGKCF